MAGRMLLSGIGINKSVALSNATKMPPTRFVGGQDNPAEPPFEYFSTEMARAGSAKITVAGRSVIQRGRRERRTSNHLDAGISIAPADDRNSWCDGDDGKQEHERPKDCFWRRSISHPNVN